MKYSLIVILGILIFTQIGGVFFQSPDGPAEIAQTMEEEIMIEIITEQTSIKEKDAKEIAAFLKVAGILQASSFTLSADESGNGYKLSLISEGKEYILELGSSMLPYRLSDSDGNTILATYQ